MGSNGFGELKIQVHQTLHVSISIVPFIYNFITLMTLGTIGLETVPRQASSEIITYGVTISAASDVCLSGTSYK